MNLYDKKITNLFKICTKCKFFADFAGCIIFINSFQQIFKETLGINHPSQKER